MNEEALYYAACLQIPHVGPKNFTKLLTLLQRNNLSVQNFWGLSKKELEYIAVPERLIEFTTNFRNTFNLEEFSSTLEKNQIQLCIISESSYPTLLKEIPNPPPVLYFKGELSHINQKPIAVVGTRKITQYGKYVTTLLTTELVEHGYSIVSGFMYGVDALAHQIAIEHEGYTVGVLGFGLLHMYPTAHELLVKKVLDNGGCLISEYPPHVPPHPSNFPARNRIVAGLSLGVLVTEAAKESGSKITAQYAGEYGREVFSVSGAISSIYAEGVKDLVNSGAKLVTSVQDIIEEFETLSTDNVGHSKQIDRDAILNTFENTIDRQIIAQLLGCDMEIDELVRELEIDVTVVGGRLTMLELRGAVMMEGGRYHVQI